MDLRVTLGGHQATWRFSGSHGLREWVASQPWLDGGACVLLHLGPHGDPDAVHDELRRAVRSADESAYSVTERP